MASRYAIVEEAPCEWCAVWTGPHAHLLREDGTLGVVIVSVEQARRWVEG